MIAIVMAGGKATRFSKRVEKATLDIGGKTLLERTVNALREGGAEEVVVAVAPAAKETRRLAIRLGAEVAETSGVGYHEDVLDLLRERGPFMSLNVDVPFVTADHVRVLAERSVRGSVSAVVPLSLAIGSVDNESALIDDRGKKMLWVGLNYVTPNPMNYLEIFDDPLLTVNVNNESDLEFARKLAAQRGL